MEWILGLCAAGLAVALFAAIVTGTMPHGGAAGVAAWHAFQPKDKQAAADVVVQERAGILQYEMWHCLPSDPVRPEEGTEGKNT